MDDSKLVVVHTFNNRGEADLAVSALAAAEIDAIIRADSGGEMRPSIAWAGVGYQVIVREQDATAAREILDLPAKT